MRGIYKITNKINNKVYIGESMNIERRWEEHIEDLNNNQHHSYKLQEDWNTYGKDNFEFEVIEELEEGISNYNAIYVLIAYEDKYIKQFDSLTNGYNVEETLIEVLNGNKKINHPDSTRDKGVMRNIINNIKENNDKYNENYKGLYKRNTEKEEKQKQAKNTEVICIETNLVYKNAKEATKKCNISCSASVTIACRNGGGKAKLKNGQYLSFKYVE